MFGKNLFGKKLFAKASVKSEYIPSEDFAFNSYGLQNKSAYGVHITNYDEAMPNRDFKTTAVPGGHGMIAQDDNFRENPVTLYGWISAPNRIAMEEKVHELMKNIYTQGGTLYIRNGEGFKSIETTLINATFDNQHGNNTIKKFTLEFSGISPFFRDIFYNSVLYSVSDLVLNGDIGNNGGFDSNPVAIVSVSSATSITALEFKSVTTGEVIKITENISDDDVIIFDSENSVVTLNGVEIEFEGKPPRLLVGLNSFTITATGTSISYEVTVKQKNNYLTP